MTTQKRSDTLSLINILLNKDIYNKYINNINYNNNNKEKEEIYLYTCLRELHEKFDRNISFDEYQFYVLGNLPVGEDRIVYEAILSSLLKEPLGDDIILDVLEENRRRKHAYDIACLAIDVSEGKKGFPELQERFKQVEVSSPITETFEFVTDDLQELYDHQIKQHGLRWRLNTLNRMLGSLRKGDFGFIFARPESGKTTFLASELTYFAQQTEAPLLWFNNEEGGAKVKLRCYQASLGLTLPELFRDVQGNRQKYHDLTGGRIKIFDSANISRSEVERICDQLQPACVVFDQIDKITGFDGDREDLRLGTIYQWSRELAKQYCPVIGVTQSDGSGEGKKWLTMDNVANAKTAKQAEADWILGIGKIHDDGYDFVRYLHASKNKLQGDEDSVPELRHGKTEVILQPEIARYKDYD